MGDRNASARSGKMVPLVFFILAFGVVLLFILHIGYGKTSFTPKEVILALFNLGGDDGARHIVWNLRFPRALVAVAAGVMLGIAGAILQTILRNPLVEPGLVGASSGAVLFAVLWGIASAGWNAGNKLLQFVALAGGLGAAVLVFALNANQRGNSARLALVGVIVTSILQSTTSLLLLQNQQGLTSIFLWLFGSLNGRGWSSWSSIWPWALAGTLLALAYARKADILRLGDEMAAGLGLAVNRTRFVLLLIASALTAAAVSVVGAIGFIGLIGPHIAGLLAGRSPAVLFPVSGLMAAFLLLASDWIGQSITIRLPLPGMENHTTSLPVGAVTTLLGAPFFLYLLRKSLVRM
ncbi:FecCD family ABC transporter permease [Paenibacillus alkalitolerans]|uniref:FecCD family ABC transporter permease n=1 Tax=Paenibacillus alkalitolerans TaxID=2799335 RepID=UPI0018F41D03|nr:iron ABC transporter permease [Paenibacillus alkalitolerans]